MTQLPSSDVPSDIEQRIISAADQLYDENGRLSIPNVDTVRRRARVNMNDASAVMRVWRRTHSAVAAAPTASIPEPVQGACQALLASVWTAATESANTSLQMAQLGWEQERAEAEACRQQLAGAFDNQTEELALAQRHADTLTEQLAVLEAELQDKVARTVEMETRAVDAETKAATVEARADEMGKRVDDLKTELSRAHQSADQERQDSKQRLQAMELTISSLREEARRTSSVESELREELARLRGQADVLVAGHQGRQASSAAKTNTDANRTGARATKRPNGT